MRRIGETLEETRNNKGILLKKVSEDLHIKEEVLDDLEKGHWEKLPEPTYVKGILRSYSKYLDLDHEHMFALYRREFDEKKYLRHKSQAPKEKRFMLTPNKVSTLSLFLIILLFILYLTFQYLSFLKAPKLEIFTPEDDITTTIPIVQISGKTDKEATVVIDGNFTAVDKDGYFSFDLKLNEGKNQIEIIAAKRLSPKSKIMKIIRLTD